MPQEFLTAIALLAPGIAAGFFYAAHQGPNPKAWAYLGYACAFTALDIAFVMGMVLVIRGQNYLLAGEIGKVQIYLFVLLLSIAGAAGLYIAMRLKDLVVYLVKGMFPATGKGKADDEKE